MAKRLIPFRCLPGSWGLKGKTYLKAKAEYELEGYELEKAILEIDYPNNCYEKTIAEHKIELQYNKISQYMYDELAINSNPNTTPEEKKKLLIEVSYKHGKISETDYKRKLIDISNLSENDKKLALLDLDYSQHKLNETEYTKQKSTLLKQPWVSVVSMQINKENPTLAGEVELDWNEYFIEELKKNGFNGPADVIIVEQWFGLLCSAIASENGIINNADKNPEETTQTKDLGDGKREYF